MLNKRIEAAERGDKIYDGSPCRTCGNRRRYVSTNACSTCQREHTRKHKAKAREAIRRARA